MGDRDSGEELAEVHWVEQRIIHLRPDTKCWSKLSGSGSISGERGSLCLKKSLDPKRRLSPLSRDTACPADLPQHFEPIEGVNQHLQFFPKTDNSPWRVFTNTHTHTHKQFIFVLMKRFKVFFVSPLKRNPLAPTSVHDCEWGQGRGSGNNRIMWFWRGWGWGRERGEEKAKSFFS